MTVAQIQSSYDKERVRLLPFAQKWTNRCWCPFKSLSTWTKEKGEASNLTRMRKLTIGMLQRPARKAKMKLSRHYERIAWRHCARNPLHCNERKISKRVDLPRVHDTFGRAAHAIGSTRKNHPTRWQSCHPMAELRRAQDRCPHAAAHQTARTALQDGPASKADEFESRRLNADQLRLQRRPVSELATKLLRLRRRRSGESSTAKATSSAPSVAPLSSTEARTEYNRRSVIQGDNAGVASTPVRLLAPTH